MTPDKIDSNGRLVVAEWATWQDFDEEGDNGQFIIGDLSGDGVLCSLRGATPRDIALASAAPLLLGFLKRAMKYVEHEAGAEEIAEFKSLIARVDGPVPYSRVLITEEMKENYFPDQNVTAAYGVQDGGEFGTLLLWKYDTGEYHSVITNSDCLSADINEVIKYIGSQL